MDADVLDQLTTDLRNIASWNSNPSVTWKTTSYTCLSSRIGTASQIDDGGIFNNYAGKIVLALRDFQTETPSGSGNWVTGTLPKPNEYVTISSKQYKIDRVITSNTSPVLTLILAHGQNPLSALR